MGNDQNEQIGVWRDCREDVKLDTLVIWKA